MSCSPFVRWVCNHCGVQEETSTRSKPKRGITYATGEYESPMGTRPLPDIWLCKGCAPKFAKYCGVTEVIGD